MATPAERPLTGAEHARLRRARKESERFESERKTWESERGQAASRLQELEKKASESAALLESIKADPIGWAQKAGVDPNAVIRKFLGDGTPDSRAEEAIKRAESAEKRLNEFIEAQKQAELDREKKAIEANVARAIENVYQVIATNKKEWPYTNVALTPNEIRAKLQEIQRIGNERKETYTLQGIRDAFEKYAKSRYEQFLSAKGELLDSSAEGLVTSGSPPAKAAGNVRQTAASKQPPGTSIPPAPKRRTPLTPAEQRQADLAALKAAMAKDKASRASKPQPAASVKSAPTVKPPFRSQRAAVRH